MWNNNNNIDLLINMKEIYMISKLISRFGMKFCIALMVIGIILFGVSYYLFKQPLNIFMGS